MILTPTHGKKLTSKMVSYQPKEPLIVLRWSVICKWLSTEELLQAHRAYSKTNYTYWICVLNPSGKSLRSTLKIRLLLANDTAIQWSIINLISLSLEETQQAGSKMMYGFSTYSEVPLLGSNMSSIAVESHVQEFITLQLYVNRERQQGWWLYMVEEEKLKKTTMDLKENFQCLLSMMFGAL